jgi:hypothetical protein
MNPSEPPDSEAEEAGATPGDDFSLLLAFSEGGRPQVSCGALALPSGALRFTEYPSGFCRSPGRGLCCRALWGLLWMRSRWGWGRPGVMSTRPTSRLVSVGGPPSCCGPQDALTTHLIGRADGTEDMHARSRRRQAEIEPPGSRVADHLGPLATAKATHTTSQYRGERRCTQALDV